MAKNIADVRDTIGIKDRPIAVCAMEKINIIELGKDKLEAGNKAKVNDVKSTELSENVIIAVSNGSNPNKQEEMEK